MLEFENRDLRIRELKHECFRLFNLVLAQNPGLADEAPYNPHEVLDDFMDEEFDKQAEEPVGGRAHGQGVPVAKRDLEEIAFLEKLLMDLQRSGPNKVRQIFQS